MTKVSRRSDGTSRGDISSTKGALVYFLRNPAYIGGVDHKDRHCRIRKV